MLSAVDSAPFKIATTTSTTLAVVVVAHVNTDCLMLRRCRCEKIHSESEYSAVCVWLCETPLRHVHVFVFLKRNAFPNRCACVRSCVPVFV